ncbi:hypothetical protein ACIO3O_07710 [Streptomyces sp. NPDC087440]|uniref:hypothetical protein n=1 Tax=Streptomyces sp. NPDC087440 TaxID=3365790 RepID=UPI0038151AA4
MGTEQHRKAVEGIREAEVVREDLRDALKGHGIYLPSLGLDAAAMAATYSHPLLELGRCNLDTARQLTAALRK